MAAAGAAAGLPELESVAWRPIEDARSLRLQGRRWTAWTTIQTVPFVAVAVVLVLVEPLTAPVAAASLFHAWIIPELYAFRGSNVMRPPRFAPDAGAELIAQGLLADLLDHYPRDLHHATGLALERGALGVWLVGSAGAVLVVPGGRRVHCFCVGVAEASLPPSDRVAHLLLALRTDERGFATVANNAFSGAAWRLRRRMSSKSRPALDAATRAAGEHEAR